METKLQQLRTIATDETLSSKLRDAARKQLAELPDEGESENDKPLSSSQESLRLLVSAFNDVTDEKATEIVLLNWPDEKRAREWLDQNFHV